MYDMRTYLLSRPLRAYECVCVALVRCGHERTNEASQSVSRHRLSLVLVLTFCPCPSPVPLVVVVLLLVLAFVLVLLSRRVQSLVVQQMPLSCTFSSSVIVN